MPRYCLLGHVDPNRLDEYREAHSAVWPELLEALRDAGWRNYSLFVRDDGLLIGYAEADDLAVAQERVATAEVNTRWQAAMAELFQSEGAPDEAWEIIPEVFNLEDQLRAAGRQLGELRYLPAADIGGRGGWQWRPHRPRTPRA